MRVEVRMPSVSAGMEVGTVVSWCKSVGDPVRRGEVIAKIQTDKAELDLEARASGTVTEIVCEVDQEVPVGTVIAYMEAPE